MFIVDIFHVSVKQCLTIVQIALVSAFSGLSLVSCLISAVLCMYNSQRKDRSEMSHSTATSLKTNIILQIYGLAVVQEVEQTSANWKVGGAIPIVY